MSESNIFLSETFEKHKQWRVGIMKRYERFGESSAEEGAVKMIIGDAIDNVREYSDSDLEALYLRYKVMKQWLNEVVDDMPAREQGHS